MKYIIHPGVAPPENNTLLDATLLLCFFGAIYQAFANPISSIALTFFFATLLIFSTRIEVEVHP